MQDISPTQTAVNRADGDHIPWGWVALTVVGLEIALVLSAVAWVAIYSYLINPGHDSPYYQNHAEFASPIVLHLAFHISSWRVAGLDVKRARAPWLRACGYGSS